MAGILAIVSQKGGVGKTTTAVNVAAALARRGVTTLLVDADPQGAVRYGLGLLAPEHRVGLSDFIENGAIATEVIRPTVIPWLRVVTAGHVVESAEHDAFQHAFATSPRVQELFDRAMERGYVVVVDTPPGLGPVTRRVLSIADRVLVPLQCEPLALQTTAQALRGIRSIIDSNPKLSFEGVLLTMLDESNPASLKVAEHVRAHLPPDFVSPVAIPRTQAAVEAFAAGQPVVVRAPDDSAAEAYRVLAQSLEAKLR